jgi:diguanylate cyclase (GGDEF)-like protein/PAS domain S-box-containing protein
MKWPNAAVGHRLWFALVPPLVAVLLQWWLWSLIQPYVWFLFFPAVFASSWFGGKRAGLLATAVSVVLVWWLFIPPQFTWHKGRETLWFPALVFTAMGVIFSLSHDRLRRSEQRIRDLFDQAGDGIFIANLDGRYIDVNDAGCRMLGYARSELVGKTIGDLIPPEDVLRLAQSKQALLAGETQVAEWTLRRKDGKPLAVEVSAKILRNGQWQALVRDIGERRQIQAQLRQAATVFDSTNEGIMIADADGRIANINNAFTTITGFELHEVVGRNPSLQHSGRHDEAFFRDMWASITSTGQWQGMIWNRRKNGEVYPAWENISAIKDATGVVSHYVAVLADITPIQRAEERLRHLAHHDPLTGLPNRLLFASSLLQSLERAKRHDEKVALLFIDLDRFKLINDSMGHGAGDELLKEIGHRLKSVMRAQDVVARLGGDEFTITMDEIKRVDDVATLAQKIIAEVSRPVNLYGHDVVITPSVGIALYPDDAGTVDDLTRAADSAMYRAKERGRSTYEFYTRDITERVMEHVSLEAGLRHALAHGELQLHYQPQFEPGSLRLVGVEALLRWQHPQQGLIEPERFISVAEQSGLIQTIGTWVIHQACAQARAWLDQGLAPVRMAINVSGWQILHDGLVNTVKEAQRTHGLRSDETQIELEITETVLQTVEPSAAVLQQLRALGVRIAIDDFGTGYSSLSMLKQLPIDTLKIDRLFVRNTPEDSDSRAIVSAVISMAHTLGLRVVAEGVETQAQLDFLRDEGCDEVQGYLLGRPAPAADTARLLAHAGQPARQADMIATREA